MGIGDSTIPPIVLVIPLFVMFRELGLTNAGDLDLGISGLYAALAVWMLIGFFGKSGSWSLQPWWMERPVRALIRVVYPL